MSRDIRVRTLTPERIAELKAQPKPRQEVPTKFARLSDSKILELDLDPSLSREDSFAVQQEMSTRGLYGN